MSHPSRAVCFLAALLLAYMPLALPQETFTQIDYPGSSGTYLMGINAAGEMVGAYLDQFGYTHGLLLSGGVYTTFDYNNQSTNLTAASAINDNGQIVGRYIDGTTGASGGFLYELTAETFTSIQYPGAFQTMLGGISNSGTIVGSGFVSRPNWTALIGFEWRNGRFHEVVPPTFHSSAVTNTSNRKRVVGTAYRRDGSHQNFIFQSGQYQELKIPVPNVYVLGINDKNVTTGYYSLGQATLATGFVYRNGVSQSLAAPGAISTTASGINNAGTVVGWFYDSFGQVHGFMWTSH